MSIRATLESDGEAIAAIYNPDLDTSMRTTWMLDIGREFRIDTMRVFLLVSLIFMCASFVRPIEARESADDCAMRDGDRDGVSDCRDKCPDSKAGEVIGSDGCIRICGGSLQPQSITFASGTAIAPKQETYLRYELEQLRMNPNLKLEIVGHSDLCDSPQHAEQLGLERATAVSDWFIRNGLNPTRIVRVRSAGSDHPAVVTTNQKPDCDVEANRRVDRNVRY